MEAIIMAAGIGTRLRPITDNIPKALIKVNDKPMIETIVESYIEINIKTINIVVGYMKEKFHYLSDKYNGINFNYIENSIWETTNTCYSLILGINNSNYDNGIYVSNADLVIIENILKEEIDYNKSYVFTKKEKNNTKEWAFISNEVNRVTDIVFPSKNKFVWTGCYFMSNKDVNKFISITSSLDEDYLKKNYWEQVLKDNVKSFDLYSINHNGNPIIEIDTLEELKEIDKSYKDVSQDLITMLKISIHENFLVSTNEISNLVIDGEYCTFSINNIEHECKIDIEEKRIVV